MADDKEPLPPLSVLDALGMDGRMSPDAAREDFAAHLKRNAATTAPLPHALKVEAAQRATIARVMDHYGKTAANEDVLLANMRARDAAANARFHPDEQDAVFQEWCGTLRQPIARLDRPESSRFTDLVGGLPRGGVLITNGDLEGTDILLDLKDRSAEYEVFLMQHDWAGAFGLEVWKGEVRMPFDRCAFEFQIEGRRFLVVVLSENGEVKHTRPFVQMDGYWTDVTKSKAITLDHPLILAMWGNINGLCIALDAEIAVSTVIRQPAKLNASRVKSGKLPLFDYRTLNLSRKRVRYDAPDTPGDSERRRVRLHLRRGHWRHFETYKVWVKWCLVGDPDLGFIEKSYRA